MSEAIPLQVQSILSQVKLLTPSNRKLLATLIANPAKITAEVIECELTISVTTGGTTIDIYGHVYVGYDEKDGELELGRYDYDTDSYTHITLAGECISHQNSYGSSRVVATFDSNTMLLLLDKIQEAIRTGWNKWCGYDYEVEGPLRNIDNFRAHYLMELVE